MSVYDRDYARGVRVEFIGGPLDGLIHWFTEDQVRDEPQITERFDGQTFAGAYVVLRRLADDQWIARYTATTQDQAAA